MKKIKQLIAIMFMLFLFNNANALEIVDVYGNYWASQEIIHSIQNGYIYVVDSNKFKPEGTMTRTEFVTALLKVISRQNEALTQNSTYKDIDRKTPNVRNIMLSEQIRMSFGYPDKTFKPNAPIDHNETMSMIANITKGDYVAADITYFKDYKQIPIWARRPYIKNVANGFYVNHPDGLKFTPSNKLTRAEAAVLFDKIRANLDKVKDEYRDIYKELAQDDFDDGDKYVKSTLIGQENLNIVPFAKNDKVQIYDNKKIIEAGNILIAVSQDITRTRKDLVGDEYVYVAPNDVYTQQGTFLLPKGTEFYARVEKIGYSAWRSKPEKSTIVFHKYSLPTGETYDMAGVPFTKREKLIYANSLKPKQVQTLASANGKGKDYLINVAHQRSPLTEFNIDKNKTIYIYITGDTVIPQNADYINFRTKKSLLEQRKL